jgi:hypothetical protein
MAKVKNIQKTQPQAVQGFWQFLITLDTDEEAYYADHSEEPFKVGQDIGLYRIDETKSRAGTRNVLTLLTPEPEEKKIELTVESGEKRSIVLAAKAKACIELVGPAQALAEKSNKQLNTAKAYGILVDMVWKQLEKI